jgi:hydrogenase nickel incorporation protein HypB
MSVTEGEDKPLKYPTIFNTADVAVITKIDLACAVEFDSAAAYRNIQSVRPGMEILEVSVKSGAGMERWMGYLATHLSADRGRAKSDSEPGAVHANLGR